MAGLFSSRMETAGEVRLMACCLPVKLRWKKLDY